MADESAFQSWLSQDYSDAVPKDIIDLISNQGVPENQIIPAANIIHRLSEMPWYTQEQLLEETELSKSELIINHMERQPLSIATSDLNTTSLVNRSQKEEMKIIDSIKTVYLSCMSSSNHTDQLIELMNSKTEEHSPQIETESNYSLDENKVGRDIIA